MGRAGVRRDALRRDLEESERHLGALQAGVAGMEAACSEAVELHDVVAGLDGTVGALRAAVGALARRAEALAEAASRYEQMFDGSPDGLVETTDAGVVRQLNRRASAMLGARCDQLVGTSLAELVDAADRRRFRRFVSSCQASGPGRGTGVDVRIRGRAGEPFDAAMHVAAIESGSVPTLLWTVRDMSDRQDLVEQLTFHATHDHLTMVANRRHFLQILARRLRSRASPHRSTVVLFIDLDRFKAVNDRYGHPAGDELLAVAGERLRSLLRDGDLLGRIGGDEFAIALDDEAGGRTGAALAERILVALSSPFVLSEGAVSIAASIGMVVATSGRMRAEDVLRDADIAMCASKEAGGNRWTPFSMPMRARAVARLDTETELRTALDSGQLTMHYQPVVDLADGHVVAVEALLRWNHPVRGLLAATEFVGDLEDTGLIATAGEWALRRATGELRGWIEAGAPPALGVLVNVSPQQFADPGFAEVPVDAARRAGLAPGQLCIEVTERTAVESGRRGVDTLRKLHGSGVRVALDDFGTGYSSLTYLHDLPVDVVKIDQSFVARLQATREDRLIVVAIVQLARTLGLTTVAEGAEAIEQIGALRAAGCDQVQGYYVCPPLEPDKVAALLVSGWHLPPMRRARATG